MVPPYTFRPLALAAEAICLRPAIRLVALALELPMSLTPWKRITHPMPCWSRMSRWKRVTPAVWAVPRTVVAPIPMFNTATFFVFSLASRRSEKMSVQRFWRSGVRP